MLSTSTIRRLRLPPATDPLLSGHQLAALVCRYALRAIGGVDVLACPQRAEVSYWRGAPRRRNAYEGRADWHLGRGTDFCWLSVRGLTVGVQLNALAMKATDTFA